MFCFWGEAGIGKTRLVKEIFKELQYSLYDIYEIHLNKNNQKTVSDIIRFLNTKNYILKKSCKINEFSNCINASNNYVKTALIFIDDLHYAENEFIEQIKKSMKSITKQFALLFVEEQTTAMVIVIITLLSNLQNQNLG